MAERKRRGGRRPGSGRKPRVEGTPSTVVSYFCLTAAEREHLNRVARDNGCTPTAVVRDAVLDYCAAHDECNSHFKITTPRTATDRKLAASEHRISFSRHQGAAGRSPDAGAAD
jgi:hypothetical protein